MIGWMRQEMDVRQQSNARLVGGPGCTPSLTTQIILLRARPTLGWHRCAVSVCLLPASHGHASWSGTETDIDKVFLGRCGALLTEEDRAKPHGL